MPERRLSDLDPKLSANGVSFACPACGDDDEHSHRIHVQWAPPGTNGDQFWSRSGETAADLTLSPSIDCTPKTARVLPPGAELPPPCTFHGWIRGGIVQW